MSSNNSTRSFALPRIARAGSSASGSSELRVDSQSLADVHEAESPMSRPQALPTLPGKQVRDAPLLVRLSHSGNDDGFELAEAGSASSNLSTFISWNVCRNSRTRSEVTLVLDSLS